MTIVLLSICFISWPQEIKDSLPVKGIDTTFVSIPICVIKQANIKLNERIHLLEINKHQEQNINDLYDIINNQDSTILLYQKQLNIVNLNNDIISKKLSEEQRKKNIWMGIGIGGGVVTVGGILALIFTK